jgi:hypothetical protein
MLMKTLDAVVGAGVEVGGVEKDVVGIRHFLG